MTADSNKGDVHCLLCNFKVEDLTANSISIFDDNAITNLEKPVINVLSSVLQTSIDETNAHSFFICNNCYKLVNEADELESRLTEIKLEICNLYQKSISELSEVNVCNEEYNDHDYIETIDNVENTEDLENQETLAESKKKSKTVTILETSNLNQSELFHENETSETIKEQVEDYQEQNESIDDEGILDDCTEVISVDNESEIEEVLVEKKDSSRRVRIKKEEPIKEVLTRDGDNYICAICSDDEKESKDWKNIISHLKDEHDCRVYICDVCGDHFRKRTELSHHLDDHVANEEGDFQCEVCNRIFSNLRFFRIHKRIHYPQLKSWSCQTCGKRYSSKNLLEEHLNTHTGNRPYVCEVCGKNFASKYTHRAHLKTHGIRPRPFQCTQCIKTFFSHQNLMQHMKTHNGIKEFVCQQCGKAFGSAHNLEVHNIVHTGYKPYICRVCGKAFARKAEIRDHERTHTGEKPYQCEFCGATFSQRSNLQSHKRATHYNDKRYKCDDCGKGFKRRRLLDYHIKAAHTGERPYKCETCSATFVYPEHFKKHMRIHTGEKPYLCEVCGKAFNSRDNRNAHRFIHSDKKPYECLVCGMGFMRKPLLYGHMQAQGHLNDTIIVNQPTISRGGEEVIIQDDKVHIIMDDSTEQIPENAQIIVTKLKDHVIIQESDGQNVLNITEQNVSMEEMARLVVQNDYVTYEAPSGMDCKTETAETEEVYGYQDEEGNTIVLPAGADIKEIMGEGSKAMRLVKIQIPTEVTEDGRTWLSLVQNS